MSVQQAKVRADCVNINEEMTYQRNTSKKIYIFLWATRVLKLPHWSDPGPLFGSSCQLKKNICFCRAAAGKNE